MLFGTTRAWWVHFQLLPTSFPPPLVGLRKKTHGSSVSAAERAQEAGTSVIAKTFKTEPMSNHQTAEGKSLPHFSFLYLGSASHSPGKTLKGGSGSYTRKPSTVVWRIQASEQLQLYCATALPTSCSFAPACQEEPFSLETPSSTGGKTSHFPLISSLRLPFLFQFVSLPMHQSSSSCICFKASLFWQLQTNLFLFQRLFICNQVLTLWQ